MFDTLQDAYSNRQGIKNNRLATNKAEARRQTDENVNPNAGALQDVSMDFAVGPIGRNVAQEVSERAFLKNMENRSGSVYSPSSYVLKRSSKKDAENMLESLGLPENAEGARVPMFNTVLLRNDHKALENYPALRHEMKHADNADKELGLDYVEDHAGVDDYIMSPEEMSARFAGMRASDTALDIARMSGEKKLYNKINDERTLELMTVKNAIKTNPNKVLPMHNDYMNEFDYNYNGMPKNTMFDQLLVEDLL